MYRVTEEQLRIAHSGTDSLNYKLLLERRDAEQRQEAINRTAGCLIREGKELGFGSKTPRECPVEGCAVTFDKGSLALANTVSCQSPVDKPQPKYPGQSTIV